MSDIPRSVRLAVNAAISDIVEAMKGSDSKTDINPSSIRSVMVGFINGIVATAYPKTRTMWTSDKSWTDRTAAETRDPYMEEEHKIAQAWDSMDDARKMQLISNYYKPEYWVKFFSRMYIPNKNEMKAKAPEFYSAVHGSPDLASGPEKPKEPMRPVTPLSIDENEGEESKMPDDKDLFGDIFKQHADSVAKGDREDKKEDGGDEDVQRAQRPGHVEPRKDEFNSDQPKDIPSRKI